MNELKQLNIPISNCISFGADSAHVMVGDKKGVASFLKKEQNELIVIGCPCHLINLAAENAAAALPLNIDQLLIDAFFYLEKSVKRKENLKNFQELCSGETRKILKHVCTRWLSLGRVLGSLANQKDDNDLIIGNQTRELVNSLKDHEKKEFFQCVRKYFSSACDYIVRKFPLQNEVLLNAEVANLKQIENSSFEKIRFFIDKFPFLLTIKENEYHNDALDELQNQFSAAQFEDFASSGEDRLDVLVGTLKRIKRADGTPKYDRLARVLCAILVIPHSNAECERVFNVVKKNKTMFRSSISPKTVENILIAKCYEETNCYDRKFSKEFLAKAKKCTLNSLQ
ncbi:hypothetical protein X975_25813, partial [Stegodyphus mimosarum]